MKKKHFLTNTNTTTSSSHTLPWEDEIAIDFDEIVTESQSTVLESKAENLELLHNTNTSAITAKIFDVCELNKNVRIFLEKCFSDFIWIRGEISNLYIQASSGHVYFSLKDQSSQVRCTMFRSISNQIDVKLNNGIQVVIQAQISLYESRGDYQLIVQDIQQAGIGLLQQQFTALKEKLALQGLFAIEHKKTLPKFPQCIGIITSPTGAAIQDILHVLKRRCILAKVIVYPTQVQGKEASKQIVKALELANNRNECDVLILARGGGSIEDLWSFNEENVAHAIFASKIPIISAVGHEIDFTIADLVADVRAPTPSAGAEIVVPNLFDEQQKMCSYLKRLQTIISQDLHAKNIILNSLYKRLRHPQQYLQQQKQHLDELERQLHKNLTNKLTISRNNLNQLSVMLNMLSPLTVLERGYSITYHNNKIVRSVKEINQNTNTELEILFHDGKLKCKTISNSRDNVETHSNASL